MEKNSDSGIKRNPMNYKIQMKEDQESDFIAAENRGHPRSEAGVTERKVEEEPKKLERKTTEEVNASAEAFIKKFRQQLLIQRLESIENYQQMLARGL
ncbi:hypothetical protein Ancab_029386 [Ancistrocladus abbreviatus]